MQIEASSPRQVRVHCFGYAHHGIDLGDGTVVHFDKWDWRVQRVSMARFSLGRPVEAVEYGDELCPCEIRQRALSLVGQSKYDLFHANCEHFANWAARGKWTSSQAIAGGVAAIVGTASVLAALLGEKKSA